MNLGIAIAMAAEAFKSKTDKAGEPYILHCLRVMNGLHTRDKTLQSIAIWHDGPEDEVITWQQLWDAGMTAREYAALSLLTHDRQNDTYETYIRKLSYNEDARLVKLSDLRDNSDITRLKGISKADISRMEKYHWAYTYLIKV